jgi:hypothetical protein
MVMMAARISSGWLLMDFWKAPAEPSKLVRMLTGTPMPASAASMASVASLRERPSGRAKLMVDAAEPPWWLTDRGARVDSKRATADRGTLAPPGAIRVRRERDSGPCRYSGAASSTTRYWLRGL